MDTRIEKIVQTLNGIRQEAAGYSTHSVVIRPKSKEWDAIFFAEVILDKLGSEINQTLEIVSHNFK